MSKIEIKVVKSNTISLPKYMTPGSAGMDLHADISEPMEVKPFERVLVPTGLQMEIPVGYEVQLRPRSGLALKHGITLINTPGTIDSDFRGEIKVIMTNLSNETYTLNPKERMAQMVLNKFEQVKFVECESLEDSERGSGGFGHTNK